MPKVYLSIGGNIGNRKSNLAIAQNHISDKIGSVIQKSRTYETEPWGLKEQPTFLNEVLLVESQLSPTELLKVCNSIEEDMGRIRVQKWASRKIDIDILFYDNLCHESETLTIPHPLLQDRNFILVPLLEIAPEHFHPKLKQTTRELYFSCKDRLKVYLNEIQS